jgi:glycosyltransferase involved in cell wall biosynthesis
MIRPYEAGAQSGILAQAAAFRVPVVTSTLPSFKLWAKRSRGGLTAETEDEYITHVTKILKDEEYAQALKANTASYAKSIEWSEIARKHFLVYEKIIRVPYGKAKYFYIPEPKDIN